MTNHPPSNTTTPSEKDAARASTTTTAAGGKNPNARENNSTWRHGNSPPSYSNHHPHPVLPPFPPPSASYMPHAPRLVPQETMTTNAISASFMWMATGSLLGMTAAAALRWLNGDDFDLFPSPRENKTTNPEKQGTNHVLQQQLQQQQMEAVIQQIQIQNQQQEKILHRLSSDYEKQRTNECVDLLRASPPKPCDGMMMIMMEPLTRIQSELSLLRQVLAQHPTNAPSSEQERDTDWDTRLSDTMDHLQKCLEQIRIMSQSSQKSTVLPDSSRLAPGNSASHSTRVIPVGSRKDDDHDDDDDKSTDMVQRKTQTLEETIRTLIEQNQPNDLRAGAQLLYLYASNLANHPTAPRYRKIFTTNDSFQKVDRLVGGKEFLMALGFVENGTSLEWKTDSSDMDRQIELLKCAASALKVVKTVPTEIDPEFVEKAVSAAVLQDRALSEDLGTSTTNCPPTPMHQPFAGIMSPLFPETPEIGLIASPPNTRKQIYDPERADFPILHANGSSGMHRVGSPILSMSPQSNLDCSTESLSPVRGSEKDAGTEATDALWK